ncbi:MAG: hypothetical protein AB9861_04330 [Methanosarcina sp.]
MQIYQYLHTKTGNSAASGESQAWLLLQERVVSKPKWMRHLLSTNPCPIIRA